MKEYSYIKIKESSNKMFKIKVIYNSDSSRVLNFSEFSRKSVLAKYNQLVSQGDILDFELV